MIARFIRAKVAHFCGYTMCRSSANRHFQLEQMSSCHPEFTCLCSLRWLWLLFVLRLHFIWVHCVTECFSICLLSAVRLTVMFNKFTVQFVNFCLGVLAWKGCSSVLSSGSKQPIGLSCCIKRCQLSRKDAVTNRKAAAANPDRRGNGFELSDVKKERES